MEQCAKGRGDFVQRRGDEGLVVPAFSTDLFARHPQSGVLLAGVGFDTGISLRRGSLAPLSLSPYRPALVQPAQQNKNRVHQSVCRLADGLAGFFLADGYCIVDLRGTCVILLR